MNPDPEFFYDLEQGSPEWFEVRRGIPTASNFQKIMMGSEHKGFWDYLYDLAGEVMCGALAETYKSVAMARGNEMESDLRERFSRRRLVTVKTVGFVRREIRDGRFVGCSPDSLFQASSGVDVGFDSILEIKTMNPRLMQQARKNGYDPNKCPNEHKAQVQGNIWITGARRAELIVGYRGMPFDLHYTVVRDADYIADLASKVIAFDKMIEAAVNEAKSWS